MCALPAVGGIAASTTGQKAEMLQTYNAKNPKLEPRWLRGYIITKKTQGVAQFKTDGQTQTITSKATVFNAKM